MKDELVKDADICVKCGLCLPHCPTYLKTRNENESPRGRIALIQAWAEGKLEANERLTGHVDNCLLCRSCESVCPAQVPYARLVDNFRDCVSRRKNDSLALALLKKVIHNRTLNRLAPSMLSFYQRKGLQNIVEKTGLDRLLKLQQAVRLLSANPDIAEARQNYYPATVKPAGDVGLFIGCMGPLLDYDTVSASIKLLNGLGYGVFVPETQACCGALDLHSGDKKRVEALARANLDAFAPLAVKKIISIASGCGATLLEYQEPYIANRIVDISQFLVECGAIGQLPRQPYKAKILLHIPCTLKNVMRADSFYRDLFASVAGLEIVTLPDKIKCCGSAGSYMLEHPVMARALLGDLLEEVKSEQPDFLLSANIGCMLHIAAGLREQGMATEVLHPAVLLNRMLKTESLASTGL